MRNMLQTTNAVALDTLKAFAKVTEFCGQTSREPSSSLPKPTTKAEMCSKSVSPNISQKYPAELLYVIFSFLGPSDVRHLIKDQVLGQFAYERMLERVRLTHDYPEMAFANYTKLMLESVAHLVENSSGFIPKVIVVDSFQDFEIADTKYPGLFSKFRMVELRGKHIDSNQIQRLSGCNLTSVSIGPTYVNAPRQLSCFSLPETLTRITTTEVEVDVSLPSALKHVSINCPGRLASSDLPRNMKTLNLFDVDCLDIDLPFPVSLGELKLDFCFLNARTADFSHLVHLKSLSLTSFEWENISLPPNLTSLELDNCHISSLEKITKLTKLISLKVSNPIISNCSAFNVEYPPSLQKIDISCPWWTSLSEVPERKDLPNNVFHVTLPKYLEEFSISCGQKIFLSGDIAYPPTVKDLRFTWVPGVFYRDLQSSVSVLRDCVFPENLESLALRYCNLNELSHSNIARLKRFRKLDLSGTKLDGTNLELQDSVCLLLS